MSLFRGKPFVFSASMDGNNVSPARRTPLESPATPTMMQSRKYAERAIDVCLLQTSAISVFRCLERSPHPRKFHLPIAQRNLWAAVLICTRIIWISSCRRDLCAHCGLISAKCSKLPEFHLTKKRSTVFLTDPSVLILRHSMCSRRAKCTT